MGSDRNVTGLYNRPSRMTATCYSSKTRAYHSTIGPALFMYQAHKHNHCFLTTIEGPLTWLEYYDSAHDPMLSHVAILKL